MRPMSDPLPTELLTRPLPLKRGQPLANRLAKAAMSEGLARELSRVKAQRLDYVRAVLGWLEKNDLPAEVVAVIKEAMGLGGKGHGR